jgi:hypothetical protein
MDYTLFIMQILIQEILIGPIYNRTVNKIEAIYGDSHLLLGDK